MVILIWIKKSNYGFYVNWRCVSLLFRFSIKLFHILPFASEINEIKHRKPFDETYAVELHLLIEKPPMETKTKWKYLKRVEWNIKCDNYRLSSHMDVLHFYLLCNCNFIQNDLKTKSSIEVTLSRSNCRLNHLMFVCVCLFGTNCWRIMRIKQASTLSLTMWCVFARLRQRKRKREYEND